jgi:hypothetical protein
MKHLLSSVVLLCISTLAVARQVAPIDVSPPTGERPLHFLADEHGAVWIRGATYKSSVATSGAQYIPYLGSEAPRNHPIAFDVRSCVVGGVELEVAGREVKERGLSLDLDRGSFVERWTYAQTQAEQSFHFAALPNRGELTLSIGWSSDLEPSVDDDGFSWSNELGGVRYGRATALDAAGRKLALSTELVGDEIVIVVPAAFVAEAEFPLVVDPIVSTFGVDLTAYDDRYSDCVHDATSGRWLVAYEDAFSAGDYDVYTVALDSAGGYVIGAYADNSAEVWANPQVANVNYDDKFLVVAGTGPIASSTGRFIKGRIVGAAGTLTWGAVLTISGASPDTNLYPDCGGDPYVFSSSSFLVAWQRDAAAGRQIVYRNVNTNGSFVQAAPVVLATSAGSNYASVSKGNGSAAWGVAWSRCPATVTNCDAWYATVDFAGSVSLVATPIAATASAENKARPSSRLGSADNRFVLVNELVVGTDTDLQLRLMRNDGTVLSTKLFSELEGRVLSGDYGLASIDADGSRFVLAYTLQGATDNTYVAALGIVGNELVLAEESRALGVSSTDNEENAVAASRWSSGGAAGRSLCTWTRTPGGSFSGDIQGAFFEPQVGGAVVTFCAGDGRGVACPCGNNGSAGFGCGTSVNANGTLLASTGSASTSSDDLVLNLLGAPIGVATLFFQGTTASGGGAGAVFGDGVRCAAGTVIRLGIKTTTNSGFFGGVATYPQPGDQAITVRGAVPATGGVRLYQAWFRNSAPYCTASTFNLSNGLRVTWLP